MYQLKIDKESLKKYDYGTVPIAGFKKLKELNLPDNYFGGRVHRIVVLKNESTMLITDEYHNIIGLLIPENVKEVVKAVETKKEVVEVVKEVVKEVIEEVVEEVVEAEVEKIVYTCDGCKKEFDTAQKIGAHRRFCKGEQKGGEEE